MFLILILLAIAMSAMSGLPGLVLGGRAVAANELPLQAWRWPHVRDWPVRQAGS